jgi:RNA polymerase sigma-70 factor (ECF subfamily)
MASNATAPRLRLITGRKADPREAAAGPADEELVGRARLGDTAAFELLYRRHAGFALNLAVRIQGNSADVEDVVHDAFVRAHQRLAELRDTTAFRSWLGSIVVRLVRSRLRRRRLTALLGISAPDPVDLDAVAAPDADPESRALLAQAYALLQTLPTDERIAWTLRHVERHRLANVAALTGCSLATAKRRILRAERYLDEHFVAPFGEEP